MSEAKKKEYTLDEIAKHTKQDDCWLIIGNASTGAFIFVIGLEVKLLLHVNVNGCSSVRSESH